MIVLETKFVTMVTVLTPAESQAVGPMQSVKLDSIQQNVFACLGILEMLRLHVIYVSIEMIALECNVLLSYFFIQKIKPTSIVNMHDFIS